MIDVLYEETVKWYDKKSRSGSVRWSHLLNQGHLRHRHGGNGGGDGDGDGGGDDDVGSDHARDHRHNDRDHGHGRDRARDRAHVHGRDRGRDHGRDHGRIHRHGAEPRPWNRSEIHHFRRNECKWGGSRKVGQEDK